jgi:2-hydroxychromene-2-carboxylate isomerase
MPSSIDFWFAIGSTYTYLSVMRIDEVACQAGSPSTGAPSMSARSWSR